jgi:hypothetical protein
MRLVIIPSFVHVNDDGENFNVIYRHRRWRVARIVLKRARNRWRIWNLPMWLAVWDVMVTGTAQKIRLAWRREDGGEMAKT